jgi:hypothetical protein
MNTKTKKTAEQMREYKRNWAREHNGLKGRLKNNKNQNTDKTHCIRGHEFTEENTVLKIQHGKIHRVCKVCRNADARVAQRKAEAEYRALLKTDPERWAAKRRSRRAEQLKRIGWTLEMFDKAWEKQCGRCAICKRVLNLDVKHNGAKAHADHEHVLPPKPREILCGTCNVGIGNLQDSPDILRAAATYIEKHRMEG